MKTVVLMWAGTKEQQLQERLPYAKKRKAVLDLVLSAVTCFDKMKDLHISSAKLCRNQFWGDI